MNMDNNESAQIVDFIAAADSRTVTPQTYGAWHLVLGHLEFGLAREAAVMALKDESIRWTEPKHILGKVARIMEIAEQGNRRAVALAEKPVSLGSPMPVCEHGKGLLYCEPCCHREAVRAGLIPNEPMKAKITF